MTSKKIISLAENQEIQLKNHYQQWLRIGVSTDPADKPKAEHALTEIYKRHLNKDTPKFLWFSSPMMCQLAIHVLKNMNKKLVKTQLESQLGSQLRTQLWSQLVSQLWSQLGSQLESQLRTQLWSQLWSQLRTQLWSQLWSQLRTQLESQLRTQLESQLRTQLWSQLESQLWSQLESQLVSQLEKSKINFTFTNFLGAHDSYWVSFYKFALDVLNTKHDKEQIELLNLWSDVSQSCLWFWPFDGLVIVSDRPRSIHRDNQGRLHNETEKAIEFRDGWGLSSINGIIVPDWVITDPKSITIKHIESERNVEVRRILIERMGTEEYLFQTGARIIHADVSHGLPRGLLQDKYNNKYLYGSDNSTGRIYVMRVSPEATTCREAHESICGFDEDNITHQS